MRPRENALSPYLPATLLKAAARHRRPLWSEWLEGTLMHCDVSGFTAMSEALARKGKEGAELMVGVLNHFFVKMLDVAAKFGGDQMKFGGDAMLLYFGGRDHALRALVCGLEMQHAMVQFRKVAVGGDTYALRMRVGAHSGRFFSASVGDPGRMLHYVLIGREVRRAAEVEAAASTGGVFATKETIASAGDSVRARRRGELFAVSTTDAPECERLHRPPMPPAARRYLPGPMRDGRTTEPGEHRRVTTLFIESTGADRLLDSGRARDVLDFVSRYVALLTQLLDRHGGYLLGSDVAEHGEKFIATFGAPISTEHQEAAALRFALDLRTALRKQKLPFKLRIGINTGHVFAGEVGGDNRREYTVIGDAVNLSARLMSAAGPNSTLTSRTTAEAAGQTFRLVRMQPVRVKGKSAPVEIRRLEGLAERSTVVQNPLVGREAELATLLRLASTVKAGRFREAYVWGEPGIGKSRLTAEVSLHLERQGWLTIVVAGQPHTSDAPFGAWSGALRRLAEQKDLLDDARALWDLLHVVAAPRADDPRQRRQMIIDGIVGLATKAATVQPVLLLIEDAHWVDAPSMEVVERLRSVRRLFACITSRSPPGASTANVIPIGPLNPEQAKELARQAGARDAQAVAEKARGNPLFLVEMGRAGISGQELPGSVEDLLMTRVDQLSSVERQVLRAASVAGHEFTSRLVTRLATPLPPAAVNGSLRRLQANGFTRTLERRGEYAFSHELLSNVVYESTPFAMRRRMHQRAGEALEAEHPALEMAEALLRHFSAAGVSPKAVRYAALSGEKAAAVFANDTALEYFGRALDALEESGATECDRSVLLERMADVHEVTGRHRDALGCIQEALESWNAARRRHPRFAPWRVKSRERTALLSWKAAVAAEHASDYNGALEWLRRAREAAPARGASLNARISASTCGTLFRKGDYSLAIEWGRRAVSQARRARNPLLVAYAQNMTAAALIERGKLREAIRYLRPAVRTYHELRDFAGQAVANNNLGSAYQLLGMYDAALYHYDVALRADERVGDEIDAAIVRNNTAETLLLLGREDEAITRLENVLAVASITPDLADLQAWAHVTLARCYREEGRLGAAERHLRRGLRSLKHLGSEGLLAEALVDVAEQALAAGAAKRAMTAARSAGRYAVALDARLAGARAWRVLGEAQLTDGKHEDARASLRLALDLSRRAAAEYEEARASVSLARALLMTGDGLRAQRLLQRSRRAFSRMGARRRLDECEQLLMEASR